jgi:hypothetical protein
VDWESINFFKVAFNVFTVCVILRVAHFAISFVVGVGTIVYKIGYFLWAILLILFYSARNSFRFVRKVYRDEVKNMCVKICLTFLMFASLTGCASVFKKPGDELVKSPCEVCKKAPFYVNGKRI